MIVHPRYDGPPIVSIDGSPGELLQPVTRQRRRMQAMLADLAPHEWATPSRCADWAVRDVVAHLIEVNQFWDASIASGAAGNPTRWLRGFDPASTPAAMVAAMAEISVDDLIDRFDVSTDALLATLAALDDPSWSMVAESPAGHVPIRLVAQHALWDSWIHERDVALPLGLDPATEDDEIRACLQYAAAIGPALALQTSESANAGSYVLAATDPAMQFEIEVGSGVHVVESTREAGPALCGEAVDLVELLSLRVPAPDSTPPAWRTLLRALAVAFDLP